MSEAIAIVGSGGRLGAALFREWQRQGENVTGFDRAALDLADPAAIRNRLEPLGFDVLVNCAAQTNVDRAERDPREAFRVNTAAVRELAELCARKGARFIQISTDYVFDGTKSSPYLESDAPNPLSRYGESKWQGELAVLAASERHVVARVSWVFGPDRPSFVDQIVRRALAQDRVDAIADKVSVPTYTLDAAELLLAVIRRPGIRGILHVCNAGECTWQEYGQQALDTARAAGLPLRARVVEALKLAEMKAFVARRPIYTPLSAALFAAKTGITPRPWRAAVEAYVREFLTMNG